MRQADQVCHRLFGLSAEWAPPPYWHNKSGLVDLLKVAIFFLLLPSTQNAPVCHTTYQGLAGAPA